MHNQRRMKLTDLLERIGDQPKPKASVVTVRDRVKLRGAGPPPKTPPVLYRRPAEDEPRGSPEGLRDVPIPGRRPWDRTRRL
jgi:hypothetical protein